MYKLDVGDGGFGGDASRDAEHMKGSTPAFGIVFFVCVIFFSLAVCVCACARTTERFYAFMSTCSRVCARSCVIIPMPAYVRALLRLGCVLA